MTLKDLIKKLQKSLNELGENLEVDGVAGVQTLKVLENYDVGLTVIKTVVVAPPIVVPTGVVVNPAYVEAKKYAGKKESDSKFNAFLSSFWPKAGLHYKTIIGSSFAWCGLFILAMNTQAGQKAISGAAGAKSWAKYGQAVDWRKNGIPKGAVIHINHDSKCDSGADNHVTFADGDCTAADIASRNATFPGFGGNQANSVKRTAYPVADICEVRWPSELPLPKPIKKSVDCASVGQGKESTR